MTFDYVLDSTLLAYVEYLQRAVYKVLVREAERFVTKSSGWRQ